MSVTSADLLATSQQIFDAGASEADWRAVCSRSYYAIYHDGQAFHDSLVQSGCAGQMPPGTRHGRHHQLYTALKNPTVPRQDPRHKISFKLGVMMQSLHSARVKADYEPLKSVDRIEAQVNLRTAHDVPTLLAGKPIGVPLPKFAGASTSPSSDRSTRTLGSSPRSGSGKIGASNLRIVKG